MKISEIGGVKIYRKRPFLIVEAGVNHEGSLKTAFEMVDAAAETGADAIKFQSYKAETLASRHSPAYWDRTKEPTGSQFELFKKHDSFGDEEYRKLAERCKQKGILFLSTPFDLHFVDFLDAFMPVFKIASADITNIPLLRQIAGKKKPILLSVGASFASEIDVALRNLANAGNRQVALLHCMLEYPCPPEHAHLESINSLIRMYPDRTIGWSDHVEPNHNCLSLIAAWLKGADILEKHYTLNKKLPGNDHYHAMDPDDIRTFVKQRDYIAAMIGTPVEETVGELEEKARSFARRSLVAACDIPAGTKMTPEMIIPKRPGTGLSPLHYDRIVGSCIRVAVKKDDLLQWEMFLDR